METQKIKTGTITKSLLWKMLENFGGFFVSFFIQVFLARLLTPSDYGTIAISSVFIVIANVFVTTGFSSGIIQKHSVSDEDLSTIFYVGLVLSIFLYFVLFFTAPLISNFYGNSILIPIIRLQSLSLIIAALGSVQNSLLLRNMAFKKSFFLKMIGLILQGVVGIVLAFAGYGVWALVFSYLINVLANTIIYSLAIKWKPKMLFSFRSIKSMLKYSIMVLGISLFNNLFESLKSLVIGRNYDSETLGYYNRGYQIPSLLMTNIDGAIESVMFSAFSRKQDNLDQVSSLYRRTLKSSMFIVFPTMLGLILVAEPLTAVLLTNKWLESVPFMQISCLICLTWPFSLLLQALNSLGKSGVSLALNLSTKTISLIAIILTLRFNAHIMLLASFFGVLISSFIYSLAAAHFLKYKISSLLRDLLPIIALTLLSLTLAFFCGNWISNLLIKLVVEVLVGGSAYFFLAYFLKLEVFLFLQNTFKKVVRK